MSIDVAICWDIRMNTIFVRSAVLASLNFMYVLQILSGLFLTDRQVGTYVEVEMYGLPTDTVRRRKTKIVPNNGINPRYDKEEFRFNKVRNYLTVAVAVAAVRIVSE